VSRLGLRVLATVGIAVATVPSLMVMLSARASAAPLLFGRYAMTSVVRASATDGEIGASGGLTPLDSGSASIDASLDNSPTAMVLARPVEPGTTFATINSQLPTPVSVPQAQATYPGPTSTASVAPAPTTTASASVGDGSATGAAESAGGAAALASLGSTTASTKLAVGGGGQVVTATGDVYAAGFEIAGVLVVRDVRGHAQVRAVAGGRTTADATTEVGAITIAGQRVVVDEGGLHAVGSTAPFGPTLPQLTAAASSALASAGISMSLATPIHDTSTTEFGGHAAADSGGLRITITTPSAGGVVPANRVTITLGRVQLTESDAPAAAATAAPTGGAGTEQSPQAGRPGAPGVTAGVMTDTGLGGLLPPAAASAPGRAEASTVVLAGRRIAPAVALAALGGWQALTLACATFALLALRREAEDPALCPCPG
jgi:hypothetical protein